MPEFRTGSLSRRQLLSRTATGFGTLALSALLQDPTRSVARAEAGRDLSPRPPHHAARARRIIFLFMHGGPSHVDTFDHKPLLSRDHNPYGYTIWMAGGGVKHGFAYGATDDYGYYAVKDRVHIHDLHATILHLLGRDHERLTYRHAGRDFRLTDVAGRVLTGILA